MLDGSRVDLDAKYGDLFEKRKNKAVIMACNKSPKYEKAHQTEAFNTRVKELQFGKTCLDLNKKRLAKTVLNIKEKYKTKRLESPLPLLD